jgi:hypothetical protein
MMRGELAWLDELNFPRLEEPRAVPFFGAVGGCTGDHQ